MADKEVLDGETRCLSMAERFEQWMVKFGRVYENAEEKERRFKIFSDCFKSVEAFNASGNHGYTKGINQFSDLTTEEFEAIYCNNPYIVSDDDD